jgi:hypothetical protein
MEAQENNYQLKVKPGEILKTLNPLQQKKAEEIRDYWLDYVFSCKAVLKEDEAREGINNLYKLAGYEEPQTIFVGSPAACQEVANHLTIVYRHLINISEEDFQKIILRTVTKVKGALTVAKQVFTENPENALAMLEGLQITPKLPAEDEVTDAVVADLKEKLGHVFDIPLS